MVRWFALDSYEDDDSADISHLGASITGDGEFSLRAKSGTMDEASTMYGDELPSTANLMLHYGGGGGDACWGSNAAAAVLDDDNETATTSTGGDTYRQYMSVFEQDVRQPAAELSPPPPPMDAATTTRNPSYRGIFTDDDVREEPPPPSSLEVSIRDGSHGGVFTAQEEGGKELPPPSDADTDGEMDSLTPSIQEVYTSKSGENVLAKK